MTASAYYSGGSRNGPKPSSSAKILDRRQGSRNSHSRFGCGWTVARSRKWRCLPLSRRPRHAQSCIHDPDPDRGSRQRRWTCPPSMGAHAQNHVGESASRRRHCAFDRNSLPASNSILDPFLPGLHRLHLDVAGGIALVHVASAACRSGSTSSPPHPHRSINGSGSLGSNSPLPERAE